MACFELLGYELSRFRLSALLGELALDKPSQLLLVTLQVLAIGVEVRSF